MRCTARRDRKKDWLVWRSGVSDKILVAEKTCRNGAEEPALNFRFDSESDRLLRYRELTRWATNGREQMQQNGTYSITSSAAACSGRGTLSPSAFAVFKLMTISNFVGN
jgi:hypothetical protein